MATIYTHQSQNVSRTWVLVTLFFVIVIAIGWLFAEIYNSSIILYVAVAFSIIMNVTAYWYSDKIVLRLNGAKAVTREQLPELWNVVENLSITAGLPMPRLYVIEDNAPNAFATGRNKEHAVVCVTTGLLSVLNRVELEGVIAHELSHIGNRDMLISTLIVVLVGFVAIISDIFRRSFIFGGFRSNNNREGGGALLIIGLITSILAPIAAVLIQLTISRRREYLADASGVLLTRYPEGLISALLKINKYQQPMRRANNATAHLFLANPFGAKAARGVSKLFMTHPAIEDRVKALRDMASLPDEPNE